MNPWIKIKRLRLGSVIPKYMTSGSAGMDLSAAIDSCVTIGCGTRITIGTGLSFALPNGYEGQIRPRSGWAQKHGITVANSPGTLDFDYRSELKILLINHGHEAVTIFPGDRIAQLVIAPVVQAYIIETDDLDETERGSGGFGSTGNA